MRSLSLFFFSFLVVCSLAAQPVDHAVALCTMIPIPLGFNATDWQLERCAPDVEESVLWPLDRSDSVSGDLNGFAVRRTTGRGSLVYVVDTGVLRAHDEFQRDGGTNVIGGFDAHQAAGNRSPCPNFALEPCYTGPSSRLTFRAAKTVEESHAVSGDLAGGGRSLDFARDDTNR